MGRSCDPRDSPHVRKERSDVALVSVVGGGGIEGCGCLCSSSGFRALPSCLAGVKRSRLDSDPDLAVASQHAAGLQESSQDSESSPAENGSSAGSENSGPESPAAEDSLAAGGPLSNGLVLQSDPYPATAWNLCSQSASQDGLKLPVGGASAAEYPVSESLGSSATPYAVDGGDRLHCGLGGVQRLAAASPADDQQQPLSLGKAHSGALDCSAAYAASPYYSSMQAYSQLNSGSYSVPATSLYGTQPAQAYGSAVLTPSYGSRQQHSTSQSGGQGKSGLAQSYLYAAGSFGTTNGTQSPMPPSPQGHYAYGT
ncbi:hypothetical protein HPB47_013805 [Ixodes persulcatus]|uniref:Uncharacterized protein n=1 Tax=Ixodes persulcatus TaxID=34615 RepID=A0AC60QYZ7_IXOPE|nr:hypothetical protein HPB47_013805 [Ixodes persulcatus]